MFLRNQESEGCVATIEGSIIVAMVYMIDG